MSTVNAELVRHFYEVWNGGDPARQCLALLSEDFEWVNPDYAVETGVRRGHDGWRSVTASLDSTFVSYRHEPGEMFAAGDRVVCLATFHARGYSGAALDKPEPQVFTLREGKIARLEWFSHASEAFAVAGMDDPGESGEVPDSQEEQVEAGDRRPLILVFCETPGISRGLQREMRREYIGRGFHTVFADSVDAARAVIDGTDRSGAELAMTVAAAGENDPAAIDLVRAARIAHPDARTVLTTPYIAIDAALQAMNEGVLDYFLIEPVTSLDEQMFPVIADLLDDWTAWREQADRAIRVVGHERSPASHLVRDFLGRNDVHARFIDASGSPAEALIGDRELQAGDLPLVIMDDGKRLRAPGAVELAEHLGLRTRPQRATYDLVIVGGGPAGLAAAVYAASEGLETTLLEAYAPGGQAGQSSKIENYLGFPAGVRGGDLAQRALRQARRFGAEIVRLSQAVALEPREAGCDVRLEDGTELSCRSALVACGVAYRRLEAEGIEELVGRGIYYGAVTEATSHRGQDVFVIGGANSAGQAALHLAEYARRVTIVVRADSLSRAMSSYLVERIEACPSIEVLARTSVSAAHGANRLESLTLVDSGDGSERTVAADVCFVLIGAVPRTDWLAGTVERDQAGFVLTGRDLLRSGEAWPPIGRDPLPLETAVPGVFCAGDVRHGSVKRVASAVGEGAMAVQLVNEHLAETDEQATRRPSAQPPAGR